MLRINSIKDGDWVAVRSAFQQLQSNVLGTGSTPTYADLTISGLTANTLMYANSSGTLTSLSAATNGQIPIGNTGNVPTIAAITGTANRITVTNGAGSITLNTPQDIHTGASPTFDDLTLSTPVNIYALSHDSFTDFVGNEHIDHTAVTLTAGTGLTGGGDISANRSFAVTGVLEDLDTLGAATADGEFIVATGAGVFAYESGNTARTSLGLGTGDSPTFAGLSLGTGELTCGSINRASGTLTLEVGGTAELSITSTETTFGGNIIIPEDGWIGNASSGPRVEFSDSDDRLWHKGSLNYIFDESTGQPAGIIFSLYGVFKGSNLVSSTEYTIGPWSDHHVPINFQTSGTNRLIIADNGTVTIGGATNKVEISSTGDQIFYGTGGLCFAEIYANDVTSTITIAASGQANKVQVTSFDTNGVSNNMTPDHTNDHITVTKAGMYLCTVSLAIESTGAGGAVDVGASVYKNNGATEFANLHAHRRLSGGGADTGSVSLSGIIDLAINDTIELWIWNDTNTDNIVVDDVTMSLVQIGGT